MTLGMAAILISATVTIVVWPQILAWLGLGRAASIMATSRPHRGCDAHRLHLTFALAIHVGSNAKEHSGWITAGSSVGTIVMLGASSLLRVYAQNWADYGATYGSLAGIMLLMSWLWLTSLALLVAAVINKVIDDARDELAERADPPPRTRRPFSFRRSRRSSFNVRADGSDVQSRYFDMKLTKTLHFEDVWHWVCPISCSRLVRIDGSSSSRILGIRNEQQGANRCCTMRSCSW